MRLLALLLACVSTALADDKPGDEAPLRVYVGTYTEAGSQGISLLELDRTTGALASKGVVAETPNPSFLALDPGGKSLYAVAEVGEFEGKKAGAVAAFAVDRETGKLSPLNKQSSGGTGPCYLVIDRTGKAVLVANYGGGSVAALPIAEGGKLDPASSFRQHEGQGADPSRQEGPHAHSINLDAANRFAVAADLGLDRLFVYRWDAAKGTLTPNDPPSLALPAGGGPRHFAFHPDGRHAFVCLEMTSQVVPLDYDADRGTFRAGEPLSTLPEGAVKKGNSTAEVAVHPGGKFLYVSNRGHDSLAIFAIDARSGQLKAIGHQPTGGKTPRNFAIDPSGKFLLAANQDSGTIHVFRIDQESGQLEPTGHSAEVPKPVCLKMTTRE